MMKDPPQPRFPDLPAPVGVESCPIGASVGVLGRKWALVVLRDIVFYRNMRFSDILRNNPGLTPRVLAFRLKELESEGLIGRIPSDDRREVYYDLLRKGYDVLPLMAALAYYGVRNLPEQVFAEGKPRALRKVFPHVDEKLVQGLETWARVRP